MKKVRTLSIYPGRQPLAEGKASTLLLNGKWLNDLGFIAGDKVQLVVLNDNTMVLSKVKDKYEAVPVDNILNDVIDFAIENKVNNLSCKLDYSKISSSI